MSLELFELVQTPWGSQKYGCFKRLWREHSWWGVTSFCSFLQVVASHCASAVHPCMFCKLWDNGSPQSLVVVVSPLVTPTRRHFMISFLHVTL